MAIAIGDIHGCLDTLEHLIAGLPQCEELVFLGDYIDRGPDSAGVVRYLKALAVNRPCRFLKGNHEDMMLKAVRDPREIAIWLVNGGEQTLRSYGLEARAWAAGGDRERFLIHDMDFFEALENYHEDENAIFVHAGFDPAISEMKRQDPHVLLWVREKFIRATHHWQGKMIVFGHTPTRTLGLQGRDVFEAPHARGIDTGCCYGGYLTAFDAKSGTLYQELSNFKF